MYRILNTAGILFIALVAGCGSSSTGPTPPIDYVPVAVGNQWDFQVEALIYGTADQDTLTATGDVTRSVTEETTHQEGFDLFVVRDITELTIVGPDTTFTFTDTTVVYFYLSETVLRVYEDMLATDYELALMLPITVGDTWTPNGDEPNITREVVSVSETVTVPAGTWESCALLSDTDSENPDLAYDFYLTPGIGPVLYDIIDLEELNIWEIEISLTAYVIN